MPKTLALVLLRRRSDGAGERVPRLVSALARRPS
jgi:hypothetical protein